MQRVAILEYLFIQYHWLRSAVNRISAAANGGTNLDLEITFYKPTNHHPRTKHFSPSIVLGNHPQQPPAQLIAIKVLIDDCLYTARECALLALFFAITFSTYTVFAFRNRIWHQGIFLPSICHFIRLISSPLIQLDLVSGSKGAAIR